MSKKVFARGDVLIQQDEPASHLVVLASGYARRLRRGRDGIERQLDTRSNGATLSAYYAIAGDKQYASAKCVTAQCETYSVERHAFRNMLKDHQVALDVVEGMSEELRVQTRKFRTPLLAQKSNETNFAAVTVAATAECYYRSALNSVINQRLSGLSIPYFPNMHVQVPTRILYIGGLKGMRAWLDREVDPDQWGTHSQRMGIRLATAIAPGVIMTPVSSILEACNVVTSESVAGIAWRATRGLVPRCGREIIFGVGLNQMSDFFEERYRSVTNAVVANGLGSMTAGAVSGYFSHVPHNLSTFKLMNPEKSYRELFWVFAEKSVPEKNIPSGLKGQWRDWFRGVTAILLPKAFWVRTTQICGSFAILNLIIQAIEGDSRRRMRKAVDDANKDVEKEMGGVVATSLGE